MKTILILALLLAPLSAADPIIIVLSPTEVLVDDVPYGKVADAIANNRELAPAIQRALEKWDSDRNAAFAASLAAAQDKDSRLVNEISQRLARLREAHAAEVVTGDGPRAKALAAKIEALEALDEEARKPERKARRERLLREAAEKQAEAEKIQP